MKPWDLLASAVAPDGDTLRLLRRGAEFSIRLSDGNELMNSRLGGSEEALATLSLEALGKRPAPRLLIGGLGMGFTLRAAQSLAPAQAHIIVSEIMPELVNWAGTHMADVFDGCLELPNVEVRVGDVGAEIRKAKDHFDAIMLDVDNGPDGLTRAGNDSLYGDMGLSTAYQALRPHGVLAIWSAAPDPAFTRRLRQNGFDVVDHSVRASRAKRGNRHTIWIAKRPGG